MGALSVLTEKQYRELPFSNIIEEDNKIYYLEIDSKTKKELKHYLCPPMDVPLKTYDIFTGKVVYTFKNPHNISFSIKPSVLCYKDVLQLANFGCNVNFYNQREYIMYLQDLIYLANSQPSYKILGFYEYRNRTCFLWDKIYPERLREKGMYTGDINITSKGNVKEWRKGIIKYVQGHFALELVLLCAFAALLIGFIGKERSIDTTIIDFWGTSSTGKSSGARLAASVFGSPNICDNGFCDSWFSTINAIIESISNLYGVMRILDDTSSAITQNMESVAYRIANGKDKGRLNGDIEKIKSGTWRTIVMTTGESPLLDDSAKPGASVRVIEFNLALTKSAEHAQQINTFTNEQYGTAVIFFARKLLKLSKSDVLNVYDNIYNDFLPELNGKPFKERLCKIYALLLLSCNLFNEFFKMKFNYSEIKSLIINSYNSRKSASDRYEEILDIILEELSIRQNEISFADTFERHDEKGERIAYDKANKPTNKYIGRLDLRNQHSGLSELIINRKVIDDIVNAAVNNNQHERNNVYDHFKKMNYIFTYSNGYVKKCKIGNIRTPCFCFNIKILLDGRQNLKQKSTPTELSEKIRKLLNFRKG